MNYGMPYKGSKSTIAKNLISRLPPAKHFYDLFGGGGAMTHCALLSGKYQYIHYNELDPLVFKGFKMFVNGEFRNENRWISREDFNRLKDSDPYVAICFSFGNNLTAYAYSKERERENKALHYSICFNDDSLLSKYVDLSGFKCVFSDLKLRRLKIISFCKYYGKMLWNPERIELENLERLERLNCFDFSNPSIIMTNKNYSDVEIESDSVVYCDPPYIGTSQYNCAFDHEGFYEWLRNSHNQVYISEYSMPDDFLEVYSVSRIAKFNCKVSGSFTEKLYSNKPVPNPLEF